MSKNWSKDQAREAVQKAFAWATSEADTNFARAKAQEAHKDASRNSCIQESRNALGSS